MRYLVVLQLSSFFRNKWDGAVNSDTGSLTHPVTVPVQTPAQINKIFDGISYQKVS